MSLVLVTVHQLRNISVGELTRALERDRFSISRKSKSSSRAYTHPDGRKVFVHYHDSDDTIPPGTLGNIIKSAQWTEEDAKRLKLI